MSTWLSRLREAIGSESPAQTAVRKRLAEAARQRAPLEIRALGPVQAGDEPEMLRASIELLRDEDLVISQPFVGAVNRQLIRRQRLEVTIRFAQERMVGEVTVIGRTKIPSGGSKPIYGYAVTIPAELKKNERRCSSRETVGFDLAPAARVCRRDSPGEPLNATILDISSNGARVLVRRGAGVLVTGTRLVITATLPPPVQLLAELGTVVRIAKAGDEIDQVIGIQFDRENEALVRLINNLRNQKRRRAS